MNFQTKKFIEEHIDKIIKEFGFYNRKLKNSEECICYKEGKPCHNISEDELNCFLCYCPEYRIDIEEGGCKINSPGGKWLINEKLPVGKIWDCSDCEIPHREEIVRKKLGEVFGVQ